MFKNVEPSSNERTYKTQIDPIIGLIILTTVEHAFFIIWYFIQVILSHIPSISDTEIRKEEWNLKQKYMNLLEENEELEANDLHNSKTSIVITDTNDIKEMKYQPNSFKRTQAVSVSLNPSFLSPSSSPAQMRRSKSNLSEFMNRERTIHQACIEFLREVVRSELKTE